MASSQSTTTLRAVYTSPQPANQSKTFEHQLPSIPVVSDSESPEAVNAKSAYLASLRQVVPKLQEEVNVFLTERMEEDKKTAEAQGTKQSEKEAKEEENYGEENVEEEAA